MTLAEVYSSIVDHNENRIFDVYLMSLICLGSGSDCIEDNCINPSVHLFSQSFNFELTDSIDSFFSQEDFIFFDN